MVRRSQERKRSAPSDKDQVNLLRTVTCIKMQQCKIQSENNSQFFRWCQRRDACSLQEMRRMISGGIHQVDQQENSESKRIEGISSGWISREWMRKQWMRFFVVKISFNRNSKGLVFVCGKNTKQPIRLSFYLLFEGNIIQSREVRYVYNCECAIKIFRVITSFNEFHLIWFFMTCTPYFDNKFDS